MYNYQSLLVGADPELFFLDKQGNPMSAEGLLGGSKAEPKPMFPDKQGYFIQEDNVAAEFNIPACGSAKTFSIAIAYALKYIEKVAKDKELQMAFVSAMHFPKEQLQTPHAMRLGCDPDFNAWLGEQNPKPIPPETLRTAAGHVHVGWKDPEGVEREAMSKALDLFLGVPSILATQANERRQLYGKAGAIRLKPYGVEYRTLDNFWIASKENREYVFRQVMNAADWIRKQGSQAVEVLNEHEELIVDTINHHDTDYAIDLCSRFGIDLFPIAHV